MASLLSEARRYAAFGMSIIPIRNDANGRKRPAQRWEKFQTTRADTEELRSLFRHPGLTGLAVILGPVSDNLFARDFDRAISYEKWASVNPEIANVVPTVRTARGFHVYGRFASVAGRTYSDGELRGEGQYMVLPPSTHPTGLKYAWAGPPPSSKDAIPCFDPVTAGLAHDWSEAPSIQRTQETQETHGSQVTPELSGSQETQGTHVVGEGGTTPAPMPLEEAMAKALPLGPGENHHRLFLLARWVRSVEAHEGRLMPAEQYRNVFDQWFARNDFLRPDQTRDEYWLEFAGAYKDVRLPLGAGGPLEAAWRAALSSPPPGCASQFTDQKFILLVSWCRELQRLAGDKPFYLSCRTVQQRLGLPTPPRAGTILRGLVAREILDLVDKGTHRTGMASSYRYLPPLDE